MPATDLIQKLIVRGKETIAGGVESTSEFARKQPVTSAVTVGGGLLAGVAAIQIVRKKRKPSTSTTKTKKKKKTTSKTKKKSKKKSKQRQPHTAGKGKDTSTRRIRFTKNNQPYVILASGKARFIKKSSVKRMRKRKGGKY